MDKKRKYRYKKRTFLNVDEDLRAYIIAYIRQSEIKDYYTDIKLEIADCSRHVNLEFDFQHNTDSIKKTEKKIKLLRNIVNDFADAVEAELDFMKEKILSIKKAKKKSSETEELDIAEVEMVE